MDIKHDIPSDIYEIEGLKYSGDFFRFNAESGVPSKTFRIIERKDGIVTVEIGVSYSTKEIFKMLWERVVLGLKRLV